MFLRTFMPGRAFARRPDRGSSAIRVLDDARQLGRHEIPWNRLAPPHGDPTRQLAWVMAAAEAFEGDGAPRIFLCERDGQMVGAAAMALKRDRAGERLEMLGVREIYEPTDLVAVDAESRAALAEALARSGLPAAYGRLPAGSPWVDALRQAYAGRAYVRVAEAPGTPAIELDASWREPESHINAGRRSDLRRMRRHAESLGAVSVEVLAPRHAADLERPLAEAYAVEAAGWKGRRGSALALDARRGEFFRRYAEYAARAGVLRLCLLRIGGAAVAMQLAIEADGRFWLFKIGYDERFARCAPGTILMLHTIAYAAERGLRAYELLGTPEPWTALWATCIRPCVSVRAYPFSARGALAFAHDACRVMRRRLAREDVQP